ncbi:hypothetical protein PAAL66ix_14326 [Paenibacillus alvei A6-6i-x]|nr:hypothetical protein PAAL66ix_14326 [Paenibacillus alvei A6-6i-x]
MKHIVWFGLNLCLITLIFVVSIFAFTYFIHAEEYLTQSAGFIDAQLKPTRDAVMFTVLFISSGLLFISLSKFQLGTYVSKMLTSFLIIFLHIIFILYGLVLFEAAFPLTVMRLVTVIVGLTVIIVSIFDLLRNTKNRKEK